VEHTVTGVEITLDELEILIKESSPDRPVHTGFGNGRLYGPRWALMRIIELRGIEIPDQEEKTVSQRTIWKFGIGLSDVELVMLPRGAEVIHVGIDPQGSRSLWAIVDPDEPRIAHYFTIVGTGHELEGLTIGRHVGTWKEGAFVWHCFEGWVRES
jgi:hypothetical protein